MKGSPRRTLLGVLFIFLCNFVHLWNIFSSSSGGNQAVNNPQESYQHPRVTYRATTAPRRREQTLVMVTAYMHGGSSILSSIFEKNPSATFFYEPLDAIYVSVFNTGRFLWPYAYLNNPDSSFRERTPFEKEMVSHYIHTMLSCNFKNLPEVLTGQVYVADEMRCLLKCNAEKPTPSTGFHVGLLQNKTMRHQPCPPNSITATGYSCNPSVMSQSCHNSNIVAMKLLRYDINELESKLSRYPNLFVIHEFRDPRGIIHSHATEGIGDVRLGYIARDLCQVLSHDLKVLQRLAPKYPDRIKIIHYEDFAKHPLDMTSELYRFIQNPFPGQVVKWLLKNMNSEHDEGKYMRRNATETALRWMRTMTGAHKSMVETECAFVYEQIKLYGYTL